ncbi:N-alpha-acetyltransferase 50 [Nematocida ausubeli]|nr:N-alpha-acetyltransferase 50 [Nematocida ausubeli]
MAGMHSKKKTAAPENLQNEPYIVPADPDKMDEIKAIILQIFPVVYNHDFYAKLFSKNTFLQLLCNSATHEIVGLFALRLSNSNTIDLSGSPHAAIPNCECSGMNKFEEDKFMYVILIGIIEKYQGHGYGKMLLKEIDSISVAYGIPHIFLHVQTSNLRAIEFYYKSGFKLAKLITNYYTNVYPKDAFLLRKCLLQ